MHVTVRLFAYSRDLAGAGDLSVDLGEGATAADLLAALGDRHPRLAPLLSRSAVATDEGYLRPTDPLPAGEALSLIPPVSGG